ncbi:unnamed protein product [Danaus chrysippus]|uniref:(African queen) hypothetical protein n=1 Tax=Danaus chrysippus TaxID=151541 RepID=A0A8J2VTY1_9NEOP|nr:unnamed protein product [Danaus chrysippus]
MNTTGYRANGERAVNAHEEGHANYGREASPPACACVVSSPRDRDGAIHLGGLILFHSSPLQMTAYFGTQLMALGVVMDSSSLTDLRCPRSYHGRFVPGC